MLSSGYNKRLIKNKDWEISAIYDAVFAARDTDISGTTIFSTCFPSLDDMKLIVATGISKIYFYGKIDDMKTAELLNNLNKDSMLLEIIELK